MPRFRADDLLTWVSALLAAEGVAPADAHVVAAHLVEANLVGHDSHGVLRVPQYVAAARSGEVNVRAAPRTVQEFPAGGVIDGDRGFGQVVAQRGLDLAASHARRLGVGAVSLRNCYHTGRLGSYTERVASEGLIGIAMVNAGGGGQTVAPFGGVARRLATNPLSIAVPTAGEFPLVLDIATSVAPEGKLRALFQKNAPAPPGWAIDAAGDPTTNAADFYAEPPGALLPLGGAAGYKGFGLAMMVDVLAGALSGAGCCRDEATPARDGMLLIVLDVAKFGPRDAFENHVRGLIAHVKSSPRAAWCDEIFVPGEPEFRARRERASEGIELDGVTYGSLLELSQQAGIAAAVAAESVPGPHRGANGRGMATGSGATVAAGQRPRKSAAT